VIRVIQGPRQAGRSQRIDSQGARPISTTGPCRCAANFGPPFPFAAAVGGQRIAEAGQRDTTAASQRAIYRSHYPGISGSTYRSTTLAGSQACRRSLLGSCSSAAFMDRLGFELRTPLAR